MHCPVNGKEFYEIAWFKVGTTDSTSDLLLFFFKTNFDDDFLQGDRILQEGTYEQIRTWNGSDLIISPFKLENIGKYTCKIRRENEIENYYYNVESFGN